MDYSKFACGDDDDGSVVIINICIVFVFNRIFSWSFLVCATLFRGISFYDRFIELNLIIWYRLYGWDTFVH